MNQAIKRRVKGAMIYPTIVISISLVSSLQKKSENYFDAKIFWDHAMKGQFPGGNQLLFLM